MKVLWLIPLAAALLPGDTGIPRVREIHFYGLKKVTAERILRSVKLRVGEPMPPSRGELEDQIAEVPGVVRARVEAVCCEKEGAALFIGVEERDSPKVAFHSDPLGMAALPEGLADAYHTFLAEAPRAAAPDAVAREMERRFAEPATDHLAELREVLRNSDEPEDRAIAAALIGYARKPQVTEDLEYAMQDPDEAVRSNALRSLEALAIQASREPSRGIQISPTWVVELLNSLELSDRLQAVRVLVTLTDRENQAALDLMRERALPSLVEMARWDALQEALPSFLLVGRIAGLPDDEVQRRWSSGQRETVIKQALRPPKRN